MMSTGDVDTLKADIVRYVNTAYDARELDSGALFLWSENHRGGKVSFHVVGRDVDFEGTHGDSDVGSVRRESPPFELSLGTLVPSPVTTSRSVLTYTHKTCLPECHWLSNEADALPSATPTSAINRT